MTKTLALIAILMGPVALGVAQNAQQHPTLAIIDAGTNNVTARVTAGNQGAPYGFLIRWSQPGRGKHNVFFDGVGCPDYSLPPRGSIDVTIDGLSGSSCVINESSWPIVCGTAIQLTGELVGLGTKISGFTTLTDPCP